MIGKTGLRIRVGETVTEKGAEGRRGAEAERSRSLWGREGREAGLGEEMRHGPRASGRAMRAGPIEIFHNGTITRDSCIGTSCA
jgi:hypothetical protein